MRRRHVKVSACDGPVCDPRMRGLNSVHRLLFRRETEDHITERQSQRQVRRAIRGPGSLGGAGNRLGWKRRWPTCYTTSRDTICH